MATGHVFAKGSKVETRDLDSEYMKKYYRGVDDIESKHVRVDSKARQVQVQRHMLPSFTSTNIVTAITPHLRARA